MVSILGCHLSSGPCGPWPFAISRASLTDITPTWIYRDGISGLLRWICEWQKSRVDACAKVTANLDFSSERLAAEPDLARLDWKAVCIYSSEQCERCLACV